MVTKAMKSQEIFFPNSTRKMHVSHRGNATLELRIDHHHERVEWCMLERDISNKDMVGWVGREISCHKKRTLCSCC